MSTVFSILGFLSALVFFGCFIYVLVMMFQHKQTVLAIVCIVLAWCGPGLLLAYVLGWAKSSEWGTFLIMIIWTAAALVLLVSRFAGGFGATLSPV